MEKIFTTYVLQEYTTEDGYSYIGKTKNLKRAEALISELLVDEDTFKDNPAKVSLEISESPQMKEVCECFRNEFGFKTFKIYVHPQQLDWFYDLKHIKKSKDFLNGLEFDSPSATNFPPQNKIIRDSLYDFPSPLCKKDKFYDYSHNYHCFISIAGSCFAVFDAEGIMAFLLHELGHQFSVALCSYVMDVYSFCTLIKNPFEVIKDLKTAADWLFDVGRKILIHDIFPEWMEKGFINCIDYLYKNKFVQQALDVVYQLFMVMNDLKAVKYCYNLLQMMYNFQLPDKFNIVKNIKDSVDQFSTDPINNIIYLVGGGSDEKFADSFAVLYGYGAGVIKANSTWQTSYGLRHRFVKPNAFIDVIGWLATTTEFVWFFLTDTHLESQTTSKLVIEDLEKQSRNKLYPPEIRKSIKQDIKLAKQAYRQYLEVSSDKNRFHLQRLSNKLKEAIFNGKMDVRHYIFASTALYNHALNPTKYKLTKGRK